jgi:HD-GYP domain-containing protein (c-di-GMP phosphodiesterase class II)
MTSDRPYRRAMSHREALAELTENSGSQFDPNVVEALVGYLFGRRQAGLAAV